MTLSSGTVPVWGQFGCVILAFAAVLVPQTDEQTERVVLALAFRTGALPSVALRIANLIAGWGLQAMNEWAQMVMVTCGLRWLRRRETVGMESV